MAQHDTALNRFLKIGLPVIAFLVLLLLPFYIMAIVSFKAESEFLQRSNNPFFITRFTLNHYRYLFQNTLFVRWSLNTTLIAVVSTGVSLFFSILAGYALARLRFRGANALGWIIFVTYLVPQTLLFLPLTRVVNAFGMANQGCVKVVMWRWGGALSRRSVVTKVRAAGASHAIRSAEWAAAHPTRPATRL